KDKSVDVIVSLAVLEHLENPLYILIELYRVLKEGGRIIITTPSPASKPILEFLAFNLKIISVEEIRDHKHYFNQKELRNIFKRAGFRDIKIKSFQFGLNNWLIARKGKKK
ncbi:MAG: methyltransferase domain-containing protein, partial [Nanoarchaeota archaeon]|nr:methyltransferase domain-containing protein [Nanoarchaeota archaeon]